MIKKSKFIEKSSFFFNFLSRYTDWREAHRITGVQALLEAKEKPIAQPQ